eukprot:808428-Karenia_brevis.AAC.1
MARSQACIGLASGQSVIMYFVDMNVAFASMLKSIAIPMHASDESFFKALSLAGYQHEQIQACFADVQDPAFYDK